MGKKRITQRELEFAQKYVETSNASEAYRLVYSVENMKSTTVTRRAKDVIDRPHVAEKIKELQQVHAERHNVTVDDLLKELEEARQLALQSFPAQSSAAVSATMGKAKILGMDKQVIEHTGKGGGPILLGRSLDDFYGDVPVKS